MKRTNNNNNKINEENEEINYEKLREENIKRNSLFLESIGINDIKTNIIIKQNKQTKQIKSNKNISKITKNLPARRSSRITILTLQNQLDAAKETGNNELFQETETKLKNMNLPQSDLDNLLQVDFNNSNSNSSKLLNGEPLTLKNHLFQDEDDVIGGISLIDYLKTIPSSDCHNSYSIDSKHLNYSSLSLTEQYVTKVTKSRITSTFIHPSISRTLVIAGDKEGYLGIWTPDLNNNKNNDDNNSSNSSNDQVFLYKPHSSNICSFYVPSSNPDQLWSVSYDSTIRYTDIEQQSFIQSYQIESDGYVTDAFFVTPNNNRFNEIYVSLSSGDVHMVDIRTSNSQWNSSVYDGKLNSIQLSPIDENILLTSGKAGYIGLHDVRMQSKKWKPLSILVGNTHSVNAASFSPDGKYIVSVGQDNTIQAWENYLSSSSSSSSNDLKHTSKRHNNQTGRWLSTLRPVFDPKLPHTFLVGSMEQPRRLELFTIENENNIISNITSGNKKRKIESIDFQLIHNLMDDNLASVCSRNAIHPTLNMIAGGNSSGRIHLFKDLN